MLHGKTAWWRITIATTVTTLACIVFSVADPVASATFQAASEESTVGYTGGNVEKATGFPKTRDVFQIVQSAVIVVGILVAGGWAFYTLVIGRSSASSMQIALASRGVQSRAEN